MTFLAQVAAFILKWLLELGGRALFEWASKLVRENEQKKKEKEALDKYEKGKKEGASDKEMLDRERDIFNGE